MSITWVGFVARRNDILALIHHGDEEGEKSKGWNRISRNGTRGRSHTLMKDLETRITDGLSISFDGVPMKRRTRKKRKKERS